MVTLAAETLYTHSLICSVLNTEHQESAQGSRPMAQWLRMLPALAEDLIPTSTSICVYTVHINSSGCMHIHMDFPCFPWYQLLFRPLFEP